MRTIEKIAIFNFKCHKKFVAEELNRKNVAILGQNGSGKSSIIEAISLISYPKGAFSNDVKTMISYDIQHKQGFFVEFVTNENDKIHIKVQNGKKIIQLNEKNISLAKLTEILTIVAITPSLEYEFNNDRQKKRSIFDYFVNIAFDLEHLKLVNEYKKTIHQRLKILKSTPQFELEDSFVLNTVEKKILEIGYKISNNRVNFVRNLKVFLSKHTDISHLHSINFEISGFVEDLIQSGKKYEAVNSLFSQALKQNRHVDYITGITKASSHRFDFDISSNTLNGIHSSYSHGQKKIIFISFIFIVIHFIKKSQSKDVVLLIDEAFSFFDEKRIEEIIKMTQELECQVFATDVKIDNKISENFQVISI